MKLLQDLPCPRSPNAHCSRASTLCQVPQSPEVLRSLDCWAEWDRHVQLSRVLGMREQKIEYVHERTRMLGQPCLAIYPQFRAIRLGRAWSTIMGFGCLWTSQLLEWTHGHRKLSKAARMVPLVLQSRSMLNCSFGLYESDFSCFWRILVIRPSYLLVESTSLSTKSTWFVASIPLFCVMGRCTVKPHVFFTWFPVDFAVNKPTDSCFNHVIFNPMLDEIISSSLHWMVDSPWTPGKQKKNISNCFSSSVSHQIIPYPPTSWEVVLLPSLDHVPSTEGMTGCWPDDP